MQAMKSSVTQSQSRKPSTTSSTKKPEPKKSSKLTSWPRNAEERKFLYYKYTSGRERLSYQFLELMVRGEDIFKGVTKPVLKRAYIKADEYGDSKSEGLLTRKEFPYFLKYLLYFVELWKVFEKIDESKRGKLLQADFVKNRAMLEPKMTKERALEIFKQMDDDGGGAVSFDEFCNWGMKQPTILAYNNKEFFAADPSINDVEAEEEEEVVDIPKVEEEELKEETVPVEIEAPEVSAKDQEINDLRARIAALEQMIAELQRKLLEGSKDEKLDSELARLNSLNAELSKKLQEAAAAHSDPLKQEYARIKSLNDELRRRLAELESVHANIAEKMKRLDSSNQELDRRVLKLPQASPLHAELKALLASSSGVRARVSDCLCRRTQWTQELESIRGFHSELQKTRLSSAGVEKSRVSHEELEARVSEAVKEHEKLREELRRLRDANRDLARKLVLSRAQTKISKLAGFLDELEKKAEGLKTQHGGLGEKLKRISASVSELEKRAGSGAESQEKLLKARGRLADLEKRWAGCHCGRVNWGELLSRTRKELAVLRGKRDSGAIGAADFEEEQQRLKAQAKELESEVLKAAREHETLAAELLELNEVRKQTKRGLSRQSPEEPLSAELSRLRAKNEGQERKLRELTAGHDSLVSKFQKLKTLPGYSGHSPSALEQRLSSCSHEGLLSELLTLRKAGLLLGTRVASQVEDEATLRAEALKLREMQQRIGENRRACAREHAGMREEMRKAKNDIISKMPGGKDPQSSHLRAELKRVKDLNAELAAKGVESEIKDTMLREKLLRLKAGLNELEQRAASQKDTRLEQKAHGLKTAIRELEKRLGESSEKNDRLKEELNRLKAHSAELKRQLASAAQSPEFLEQELKKLKVLQSDFQKRQAEGALEPESFRAELRAAKSEMAGMVRKGPGPGPRGEEIAGIKGRNRSLRRAAEEAEIACRRMEEKVGKARRRLEELAKKEPGEAQKLGGSLKLLEAKVLESGQRQREMNERLEKVRALKAELKAKQRDGADVAQEVKEIQVLQEALAEMQKEQAAANASLKEGLQAMKSSQIALERKLGPSEAAGQKAASEEKEKASQLGQALVKAQHELEKARARESALESELEAARKSTAKSAGERQIEELLQSLKEKEELLASREKENEARIKELQRKLEEKEKEFASASHKDCLAQIKELQRKLEEKEEVLASASHKDCLAQIKELQRKLEEKEEAMASASHKDCLAQIKELQGKLEEKEGVIASASHKDCLAQIKELQQKLEAKEEGIASASHHDCLAQIKELKELLSAKEAQLSAAAQESSLRAESERKEKETEAELAAKEKQALLSQSLEKLHSELNAAKARESLLLSEQEKLKAASNLDSEKQREAALQQLEEKEAEIRKMGEKLKAMEGSVSGAPCTINAKPELSNSRNNCPLRRTSRRRSNPPKL